MATVRCRRKPGPQLEDPTEPVKAATYSVGESTRKMLKAIGGGNESKGLRQAARVAYAAWQREP